MKCRMVIVHVRFVFRWEGEPMKLNSTNKECLEVGNWVQMKEIECGVHARHVILAPQRTSLAKMQRAGGDEKGRNPREGW